MLNCRYLGGAGNPPLVILHGLLGSSRNWTKAGSALTGDFEVFALDLPSHGDSLSMAEVDFAALAACVLGWTNAQKLASATLLGHSLGGKVAMRLAGEYPHRIDDLIVVDIAPRDYEPRSLGAIKAMLAIDLRTIQSRRDADDALRQTVSDLGLRQFLLTNLIRHGDRLVWQADLQALQHSLPKLSRNPMDGIPAYEDTALFLKGEDSSFIRPEDEEAIRNWFPKAKLVKIPNAGHDIHFDNLPAFVDAVTSED